MRLSTLFIIGMYSDMKYSLLIPNFVHFMQNWMKYKKIRFHFALEVSISIESSISFVFIFTRQP